MIMNGKEWCRPAQQGLVQKLAKILHLETCGMQPRGLEGRAQHCHSSRAHSMGTNGVDARWMARGLAGGGSMAGCRKYGREGGQGIQWWWLGRRWLDVTGPGP